jgi:hypothetical protein
MSAPRTSSPLIYASRHRGGQGEIPSGVGETLSIRNLSRNFDDARAPVILRRRKIVAVRHHRRAEGDDRAKELLALKKWKPPNVVTFHRETIEGDE